MKTPKFYSFITVRPEEFGAFLFNPHMMRELPLDHFETDVAVLCDGSTPLVTIIASMARRYRTDRKTSERRVAETLHKFTGYFALRWISEPESMPKNDLGIQPRESLNCQRYLSAPLSVLWELTHRCNLKCHHCLTSCGNTQQEYWSLANGKRLIDELAELKVFQITMGGGEPLMNPHFVDFVQYATEKNFAIKLSTNGTMVNEDTLKTFAGMNIFAVQVSVDGTETTHDYLRQSAGSYKKAVNALLLFSKAGYHTVMNICVSNSNVNDIAELPELAKSIGVSSLKIGLCASLGRANENKFNTKPAPKDISDLAKRMRESEEKLGADLNFQFDSIYPWLLDRKSGDDIVADDCYSKNNLSLGIGCSAGISQVVISPKGEVYPCPYIRNSAGNVTSQSLYSIWHKSSILKELRDFDSDKIKGKCSKCIHRKNVCFGGCRGIAFAATGDLYAEDPYCWLNLPTEEPT